MIFQARQYQTDTALAWYDALQQPATRPVVAVPTGAGKTIIMSMTISLILRDNPEASILVLSHTQEILQQDYDALHNTLIDWGVAQDYQIGLYSAGLNSRQVEQITVGGIHSVFNKPMFKHFDYYLIDECHTVNHKSKGMYRTLLDDTKAKIGGMSATVFRTGYGLIYKGAEDEDEDDTNLFNSLAYDNTRDEKFTKLVRDGYLCELLTEGTELHLDTSNLKRTADDFNLKDMSDSFDVNAITAQAAEEIVAVGQTYNKWLVFAIDTAHANNIAVALTMATDEDLEIAVLHSKMKKENGTRAGILHNFKYGSTRVLISVGMITTGFDASCVDMIAMLRPTESAVLHVQMLGRGIRPHKGKPYCLVMDFAGNIDRLGPINSVTLPYRPKKKKKKIVEESENIGDKECPDCGALCSFMTKVCNHRIPDHNTPEDEWELCEYRFPYETKLRARANGASAMKTQFGIKWLDVQGTDYHIIGGGILMVSHTCKDVGTVKEYIHLDASDWLQAKVLADHWANSRGYLGKLTTQDVFDNRDQLATPAKIKVDFTGRDTRVVDAKLNIKFKNVTQETYVPTS